MFDWDSKRLGNEIRDLRNLAGLSQKDLSVDICAQATISKIEQGREEVNPLASTLFQIAERLGVPVNYFFHIATHTELDYANSVKDKVRSLINKQDYDTAYYIIKKEKKSPVFIRNRRNKQFLLWQEGIATFYINNSKEHSLTIFGDALKLTNCDPRLHSEKDIEILNSIGIIHYETKDYHHAISTLNQALEKFKKIPYIHDPTIKTKVKYNLALSQTCLHNYRKSINICIEGINWALSHKSLKLLGKLHYQIGYNHLLLKEYRDAESFFSKSEFFFELEDDQPSLKKVKEKLMQV
jgi:transcriptional regulator with XRE-family HTH domain